jgi:outer membrane receptor protein involved in Fe transport
MKNQGVGNNTQQIIRMIPGAYDGFTRSNYGIVDFSLRGFGTQQLLDGIRLSGDNRGINFDDVERIEVMPGFTGFFYGAGYAGGAVNYVLKRPTREPYNNVTVGNAGGAQYYTHGDFGGPVPGTDGRFGYRINLIYLDGESSRDYVFLPADRHQRRAGLASHGQTPPAIRRQPEKLAADRRPRRQRLGGFRQALARPAQGFARLRAEMGDHR